jgi:hypothetical protein
MALYYKIYSFEAKNSTPRGHLNGPTFFVAVQIPAQSLHSLMSFQKKCGSHHFYFLFISSLASRRRTDPATHTHGLAPTNLASGVTWPRDSGFRYLRSTPRNLSTPQGKDQSPQKTSLIGKWKLSHLRWLLPPKLGEIMRLQLGHSTHFVAPLLTGNTGGRYPHQRRPRT